MLPTIAAGEITIPLSWQQLHHGACSEHLGQPAFAHSYWCTGQACVLRDWQCSAGCGIHPLQGAEALLTPKLSVPCTGAMLPSACTVMVHCTQRSGRSVHLGAQHMSLAISSRRTCFPCRKDIHGPSFERVV